MPRLPHLARILAALFALGLASPAAAALRCDRTGGERIQASPSGKIVLVRNSNFEAKDRYLACWKPTGRLTRLADVPLGDAGRPAWTVTGFNFRGPWLTWALDASDEASTDSMRSLNVRAGRRGPEVDVPADALAGPANGPIQHTSEILSGLVAITVDGNYAWAVTYVRTPAGKSVDAVYAPDGSGGSRRLGVAVAGSIRRIWSRGKTVFWTSRARTYSVSLD